MFGIPEPQDCKVALLAGGRSNEREISLASQQGARKALEEAGYEVTCLDPADADDLARIISGGFDVAFLCTHGRGGEDGSLQGFLETIGMPYTGSGVCASAMAMDKGKAKLVYEAAGVPTPPSITVASSQKLDIDEIVAQLGDHCAVKAITEGSTLGLFIVEGRDDLAQALVDVFDFDDNALVERFISGREYTVPVIGTGEAAQALPIIEIIPKNDHYDFESKYAPGGSQHICPAPLDGPMTERVQELAVRAHRALGCAGVSRTDFIIDEDGQPWVLETNTLPGMTETSLLPDAARAAGIPFSELCTRFIEDALKQATARS